MKFGLVVHAQLFLLLVILFFLRLNDGFHLGDVGLYFLKGLQLLLLGLLAALLDFSKDFLGLGLVLFLELISILLGFAQIIRILLAELQLLVDELLPELFSELKLLFKLFGDLVSLFFLLLLD